MKTGLRTYTLYTVHSMTCHENTDYIACAQIPKRINGHTGDAESVGTLDKRETVSLDCNSIRRWSGEHEEPKVELTKGKVTFCPECLLPGPCTGLMALSLHAHQGQTEEFLWSQITGPPGENHPSLHLALAQSLTTVVVMTSLNPLPHRVMLPPPCMGEWL